MVSTNSFPQSKMKLWLAAIKPPIYSVAIMPIMVGSAVAFAETNLFNWQIFFTFVSSAILILAWLNLSNDVFDSETGIDKNKAHSIVNLTGNKNIIFWLSSILLFIGIMEIFAIALWQQDLMVLALVVLCCILGYTYQGPPFRLGYQGLGEIICFFTFGPIAIEAAYYSQAKAFSISALATSVIIGITTSLVLFCSHFHQVEDDLAAGKRSPIVRLGTAKGAIVLTWFTVGIFVLIPLFIFLGYLNWWSLLTFMSLPFAYQLVNKVNKYHDIPDKISNSKFIAVNLHFFSGNLLVLGLILDRVL